MTAKLDPQNLPREAQEPDRLAAELKRDALSAQARAELLTAMLHASDALMLFPNEREYLDLVDDLALSAPDPLSLVPVATGTVHVATGAARARTVMMQKDLRAAVEIARRPEEALQFYRAAPVQAELEAWLARHDDELPRKIRAPPRTPVRWAHARAVRRVRLGA